MALTRAASESGLHMNLGALTDAVGLVSGAAGCRVMRAGEDALAFELPRTYTEVLGAAAKAESSSDIASKVTRRRAHSACRDLSGPCSPAPCRPTRRAGLGVAGVAALVGGCQPPGEDATLVRGTLRGAWFSFSRSSRVSVGSPLRGPPPPVLRHPSQTQTLGLPSHTHARPGLRFLHAPQSLSDGIPGRTPRRPKKPNLAPRGAALPGRGGRGSPRRYRLGYTRGP
mmetsp:Transcript_33297/g.81767  ORF Transcript_33297/g.81767 Transcript_33297/m.81767 type:complete len:227 (-) Transcript_33297:152-832(-)